MIDGRGLRTYAVLSQRRNLRTYEPITPCCLFGSCEYRRRVIEREQERLPSLSLHSARLAVRDSVFHSPRAATRLLLVTGDRCASATNEDNVCLSARSYSGSRKRSRKTQLSGRKRHKPYGDRANALVRWSVVRCRVVPVMIDAALPNQ